MTRSMNRFRHPAIRTLALLVMAGAFTLSAHAQSDLRIQELTFPEGQVRLVVGHPLAGSTNFVLQQITALTNAWATVPNASARSLGFGVVELLAPHPATPEGFFRICGLVSAGDADGDGLPDAIEITLGTDPRRIDTDADGFSDGVEVAFGSNPLNRNSVPSVTTLPRAGFVDAVSTAAEGAGSHRVNIRFDKPFFGTLKYAVLPESTATAPTDFASLSGSVTVAGTNAVITLSWVNNTNISPTRLIFLQITNGPADLYARGGQTRHTIVLSDNDGWWNGLLQDKYAERNFRIKMLRGANSQIIFAAGGGQDGLPVLASEPANARSSQSEGIVPIGSWTGTVVSDTPNHFKIVSPPLPAASGGLFGAGTGLTRTLTLEVLPAPGKFHEIIPARYIGTYTEVLALPGSNYLGCTNTGTFVLAQDVPTAPNVNQ